MPAVRRGAPNFLIVCICISAAAVVFSVLVGLPSMILLSLRWTTAVGVVVHTTPTGGHSVVTVEYSAQGILRRNSFGPYSLPEGATVTVYYRPAAPQIAAIEPPDVLVREKLLPWAVASILLGGIVSFSLINRRRAFSDVPQVQKAPIRSATTLILLGVLVSIGINVLLGRADKWYCVDSIPIVVGCGFFVTQAFRSPDHTGWFPFAKSKLVIWGAVLIAIGNLLQIAR